MEVMQVRSGLMLIYFEGATNRLARQMLREDERMSRTKDDSKVLARATTWKDSGMVLSWLFLCVCQGER